MFISIHPCRGGGPWAPRRADSGPAPQRRGAAGAFAWPSYGRRCQQATHPHDVVRRRGEGEDPLDERPAAMAQLPKPPDGLHPAEALLDQLSLLLTDRVARVPGGSPIDGAPPLGGVLG